MLEMIQSPAVIRTASLFVVVGLLTLSLIFLWEGFRRWSLSRATRNALERISPNNGVGPRRGTGAKRSDLLIDGEDTSPRWVDALLLALPHQEDLQRLLERAGVRWTPGSVVLISLGLAAAFGLSLAAIAPGFFFPLLAAAGGATLPIAYLKVKGARRFAAFEEHFPEAIDLLARAARAGHSLATGLQVVGEEAEEPVAGEFRQVYEEQRFGLPFKDTLLALADRVDLVDVRIFITAVLIQRESGGNLAESLDGLARVIRGRFRFKREVKTKTAHGRMTGMVVGVAPFIAGIGMYAVNPEYMAPLIQEPMGRMLLLTGGSMMLVGALIIRRMVEIKF